MNDSKGPSRRDSWAPYTPSAQAPWDLRRVVHLHRRASFAATWQEAQRDLKDGPKTSVDRLIKGKPRSQGVPEDFVAVAAKLGRLAAEASDLGRLKAWWVYRMLFGPDPLTERLTLMWHNHFSTNAAKAGLAVFRQNEVIREFARAPFGELLGRVVHDPALLLYLDAQVNRKGHPNENLGRELMELFTLGIGHYTEQDVKEAARALTGWTVDQGRFKHDSAQHDDGEKVLLGRKGRWKGDDLVKMLLEHSATAERLAWRLCDTLMGEGTVDAAGIHALADGLRQRRLDVGWAVETVLRSEAFFAESNLCTRIVGPVEYVVGAARALELFDPSPSTLIVAEAAANLGQDLFYPPNVGGWPGGRSWLGTRAVIGRHNYAVGLLDGTTVGLPQPADVLGLARRHGRGESLADVAAFHAELFLGAVPGAGWRDRLLAVLGTKPALTPENARRVVALVLASPEAQLG
ncbi:MAG: DUF1800 domain-containing protein [Planctomycetes bacterium]|nr:DUF1800 domain-containing protein [Planctomycetota bacterium]